MGQKLVDVMSTNDRGLVGFTKNGEEVPLSAPKAGAIIEDVLSCGKTEIPMNIRRKIKESDDKTYFYFENLIKGNGINIQPYNLYTRRK